MIEKMGPHRVLDPTNDPYEPIKERITLTPADAKINELIDYITELEAKLDHVHEVDITDNLTGEPLVSGEDNEGREIWKPL